MRVAVTMINSILDASATIDGQHMVIRTIDVDANPLSLALPSGLLESLICETARVFEDCQRRQGEGGPHVSDVSWFTLRPTDNGEAFALSLTLTRGGVLSFQLPRHMLAKLRDMLDVAAEQAHEIATAAEDPRGFS